MINKASVASLFETPMLDLLWQAQGVLREHFVPGELQLSTLCNIKTGGCPENCGYCSQSAHWKEVDQKREKLISVSELTRRCLEAKEKGADRFCIAAAWRSPPKSELPQVLEMIATIKKLDLQSCATLGMLDDDQADALADAGLDYYNHNLDTSPEYYEKVVTTRTYQDRIDTLIRMRNRGVSLCCGGIIGMGESHADRIGLLEELARLQPESVPINQLVPISGTPLGNSTPLDGSDFVRTIATARILMPKSWVRISAGRETFSEELQTLCLMAGANSLFLGDELLTVSNKKVSQDQQFFKNIGIVHQAN